MSQVVRRIEPAYEPPSADRLTDREFAQIARLVTDHVGIKLPPAKRTMVEGRLRRRTRHLGHGSLSAYCAYLFDQGGLREEFTYLIDAVTTNKTDFFREAEHFSCLEHEIMPKLLKLRRPGERPTIKLWSAASSTGAEAYTMAMVMADVAERITGLSFEILGTDISTEVLTQARLAIYPKDMIAPVPPSMRDRYVMFGSVSSRQAEVRIVPELRRKVRFARLNLMDERYPFDCEMDVIFVRNVLIYFDKPTQEAVAGRLASHLRPGGFLIFGHSESVIGSSLPLRQCAPAVFQRV
ncbi:protein-glutamate O-methyltransferase CheR [Bradyrhizobium manausense]|uniref:CheR family methyltransferase n=1 Tax=Bradyrhizobium manausense TaxID=989370 RepID=UPI001BABF99C|nr:protein-glutamate O-methyltransferase CheR [Bradyrhizobium manausense]MBR0686347.1 protein-glutamate O-methyltransferase CheR [Bradyrhizobium manausense]MBR0722347.1 protein-glutamate O-methyltransferase CheR [Bradyrhizobium manausense]MBR0833480.1 protein-glutamate O-methyltransferase CheR [Bradyrhizobium manausense]